MGWCDYSWNLVILFLIELNGKGLLFVTNSMYCLYVYIWVFQISERVASSLILFPEIKVHMKFIMKKKSISAFQIARVIPVMIATTILISASTLSPMDWLGRVFIKGLGRMGLELGMVIKFGGCWFR